jgi:PAS domain S-box-containing protein
MTPLVLSDFGRALFEENGDAMFLVDPDSDRVVEANRTALRLTGFARSDLVGCRFAELFRFERAGDTRQLQAAAGKTTLFHGQDGYFLRTKADPGWMPASLTVTRLHARPKTLALITARDDTDRRAALAAVRRNEQRFRALVEKSSDGIIVIDAEGFIRYASPAAARMVGQTPTLLDGKDAFDLIHPDDRPRLRHLFALALNNPGREVAARFRGFKASTGGWGPADLVGVNRLDDPAVQGVVVNYRDVADQVRAEEALTRQHALLRTLIDSIPDAIAFKDRGLRFIGGNPAFERQAGMPMAEMLGKDCRQVFDPDWAQTLYDVESRVMTTGRPERIETWFEDTTGEPRLLDVVFSPAGGGADGEPAGLAVVARDLTDRKRLEDQVREAQKMEAIGQLAGGVAHDFNNLLTVILGNLELARELVRGSETEELLTATETAARRAADLTGQLLGFARRRPMTFGPVDLNELVHETAGLLRRTIDPRVVIREQLRPMLWGTRADAGQVNQVLMNLCLNARDAIPAGGSISLITGNVTLTPDDTASSVAARPGKYVRIRVADTGVGMPPEVKARIFEPFFTTKGLGQGTGLGLAVVFGIVHAHGGWIACESQPGDGTVFDVFLPMFETEAEQPAEPAAAAPPGRGERVLFVDDEPMIRELAGTVLSQLGYDATVASDGAEAVERFRAARGEFDLVVLDLTMPTMSGREALGQIRALGPEVPVILASGYSADRVDLRGEAVQFLDKPFSPSDLAKAVRQVLDRKGVAVSARTA